MALILLGVRIALAAVFATAGLAKLADREGSRRAVAGFGLPEGIAGLLGMLLPLAELAAAAALLPDPSARWGAAGALALLLAFSAAIALNLIRGRAPECRCFGQVHSSRVTWWTVARNVGLAAPAVALLAAGPGAGLAPAEVLAVAAALLAGAAALVVRGRRRHGARVVGLAVGEEAPEFRLPALGGGIVTLAGLRDRGRPVLLVFTDAHCGPCVALAPDLARWQRKLAGELTIAVIERGLDETSGPDEHGRSNVMVQKEDEVAGVYGAVATPSAVLVDAAGRIASGVAPGPDAIRRLVGLPEQAEPAVEPERLAPIERREFLLRLASTVATASIALAWPARALAAAGRPERGTACGPRRKACGKKCCGPGQKCILRAFGKPKCICPDFFFRDPCGADCVNTTIDAANCGRCGVSCPSGTTCIGGKCVPVDNTSCPEGCPPPGNPLGGLEHCCQGECNDLLDDLDNCGACGRRCTGGRKPTCCSGLCRDVKSDPRHCGGCFKPCPTQALCHAGKCLDVCPKPLKRCGRTCYRPQTEKCCNGRVVAKDDICGDGCRVCKAGETCQNGTCVPEGGCLSCGDTPQGPYDVICCNGDCVPSRTDPGNCGGCGRKCTSPNPYASCGCANGECYTVAVVGGAPCVASRPLTALERARRRAALRGRPR